jgi:hypothetical protein
MNKLEDFVAIYEAGRGRPRKNPIPELEVEKVKVPGVGQVDYVNTDQLSDDDKKTITGKAKNAAAKAGKDEKHNNSKGRFEIKPKYTDDDAITPLKKEDYNNNLKRLKMKFDADEPFFIQGEAGWGKTSVIIDMARRHGRSVITVYLDKAVATDLGGIPVPIEGKDGTAKLVNAMPEWAAYMLEHEDEEFLLFFDEMNQAMPDVMNALMPIVLENIICNIKFKNFIVGAAGNFKEENESGVSDLSGPLKSRFKPLIIWESGDEASWNQAFNFLRSKWGDKIPVKLIDMLNGAAQAFDNPREVEHKVLKWAYNIGVKMKDGKTDKDVYDVTWIEDQFDRVVKEEITRELKDKINELSEEIYKWMIDIDGYGKEAPKTNRSRTRNQDLIPEEMKNKITTAIKRGYIMSPQVDADGKPLKNPDKRKYGISKENIHSIFCTDEYHEGSDDAPDVINKEMLDRFINQLEADNVKFKFETDDEWKKAGYTDPMED